MIKKLGTDLFFISEVVMKEKASCRSVLEQTKSGLMTRPPTLARLSKTP